MSAARVGHLNAGTYRFLKLIAEYDRLQGWSDGATHSCAHWLNWKCGLALGAARERLRVAHALESLPRVSAAMAKGEISYSKVRAITRVASPATEDYFMTIARHGTAHHVETLVRCFRQVKETAELSREARQYATRCLTYVHDVDGSLIIKARLPAEAGALLLRAIEAAEGHVPPAGVNASSTDVPAGTSASVDPSQPRCARALPAVASSPTAPRSLPKRRAASPATRVSSPSSKMNTELPWTFGRKTRAIPPAIRRALNARDRGCRFPGCPHERYVDGHHIRHWAQGGATRLSNLVTLCRFHHRLVHEGRVAVHVLDDGALRFVKSDGESYGDVADLSGMPTAWTELVAASRAHGVIIDAQTAASHWRGERMDYGMAVETLLCMERRAPDAVTSAD